MRFLILGLAAFALLAGCDEDSPSASSSASSSASPSSPSPGLGELRVLWAGEGQTQPMHVFLVAPNDGIAARGVARSSDHPVEVFTYEERDFTGYYLDLRTGVNPGTSVCGREVRTKGGVDVTATIRMTSPTSCRIRLEVG